MFITPVGRDCFQTPGMIVTIPHGDRATGDFVPLFPCLSSRRLSSRRRGRSQQTSEGFGSPGQPITSLVQSEIDVIHGLFTIIRRSRRAEKNKTRTNCQTACKPGSVRAFRRGTAIPLGRVSPRASRDQPGRRDENVPAPRSRERIVPRNGRSRPYSVLLPVGFTLPPPLPAARGALTAPFHPCPRKANLARAVCFLWHCPWGRPRRPLAGTVFPWSPDFPPSSFDDSGRPAVWREGHGPVEGMASRAGSVGGGSV